MPGLFSRLKIWNLDDNLTSADLNAEFNNFIANMDSSHAEGYSQNLSQMQTTEDPGGVGSENLTQPISTADEIERLRFVVNRIIGGSQWYSTPPANLTELVSAVNTSNNLPTNYVSSGQVDASGQPNFLRANTTNVEVLASSGSPLNVVIDGTSYSFSSNITLAGLSAAPGSQNTATMTGTFGSDRASTTLYETISQYFYPVSQNEFLLWMGLASVGTNIVAKIGTLCAFKIVGVSSVTDYFLGRVLNSTTINGIYRGFFQDTSGVGTPRCALAGGETVTLLALTYVFLTTSGTLAATTTEPVYSPTAPSSPSSGNYWFDMTNQTWKIYNGSTFVSAHSILIGICAQDSSGNCIVARPAEIYGNYSDRNEITLDVSTTGGGSVISSIIQRGNISVYGKTFAKLNNWSWDLTANMDSGQTAAAGTWFLYVSNVGGTFISSIAPNDRSVDLYGYYHPNKPWRCIGVAGASSGTAWSTSPQDIISLGEFTADRIPDQSISILKTRPRFGPSNISNGNIGGFVYSNAVGSNSTSSTSFVQVTALTVTLIATGKGPIIIGLIGSSSSGAGVNVLSSSGTIASASVQYRNGTSTVIGGFGTTMETVITPSTGSITGQVNESAGAAGIAMDLNPTRGSNTYNVYLKCDGSSMSASIFSGSVLFAYELI